MTAVTVTTADSGVILNWDTPPGVSGFPRGEILFSGSIALPIKGAADNLRWNLVCTLPRNYVWKLAELGFQAEGDDDTTFDDWSRAARVQVSANGGTMLDLFGCYSEARLYNQSVNSNFFTAAVTNDTFARFKVPTMPGYFIDAKDDGSITLQWFNIDSNETPSTQVTYRIRCFMYTQEDLLNYAIHVPNSILPG